MSEGTDAGKSRRVLLGLVVLGLLLAQPSNGAQTITICKKTSPSGGTGFPFVWANGSSGPQTSFTLDDGQCQTFNITGIDHFNKYTETVPPGWTLSNISCSFTTTPLQIIGANPNPAFQPGDTTVSMDLNEANVTCTFTNQRPVTPAKDVYAVKFLCGNFLPKPPQSQPAAEWPVKPGNYFTAINVHNPNGIPAAFKKKAVLLYRADKPVSPETPMPPGKLLGAELKPDYGMEIDCADIRNHLLGGTTPAPVFITGWVVFEVLGSPADPLQLDVTAVYTSHGWNQSGNVPVYEGFAEDVEQILPKRVK
jgi:hypothetical protein